MKALVLLLFVVPLSVLAQTDTTLLPPLATFRADTLKPIDIREIPYHYTVKGSFRTGIIRIYSYDGIDVSKPDETLAPTILAIHNPDADQEIATIRLGTRKQKTANAWLIALESAGVTAIIVSAMQASAYKQAMNTKISNNYTMPGKITTVDRPTGIGFGITGLGLMGSGLIVFLSSLNYTNQGDHFHRAVQFYNRALSRKISWRLEPYSLFGQSGLTLRGRF